MKLRYTKAERLRKSTAETVLSEPAATSADRMAAVRCLERLERAAQRRAEEREFEAVLAEPDPAPEPTVDDMVRQLEAQKQPLQVIENKGPEKAENAPTAPGAPTNAAKAPEVTQTAPARSEAFCAFCQAAGPWNTRYPIEEPNGVLLCPPCFGKMISADALKTTARTAHRSWLYEKGEDPNTFDLSAAHGGPSGDYSRSVAIWETQARDEAVRREQEAQERDRAEAAFHRARADYISRGGRL